MRTELCNYLSFLVFGLLTECPLGKALISCPLAQFRTSGSLEEKFRLARQLSDKELDRVLAGHNACFKGRLKGCLTKRAKGLATAMMDKHPPAWGDKFGKGGSAESQGPANARRITSYGI